VLFREIGVVLDSRLRGDDSESVGMSRSRGWKSRGEFLAAEAYSLTRCCVTSIAEAVSKGFSRLPARFLERFITVPRVIDDISSFVLMGRWA
jgi:hypothetical protein